MPMQTDQRFDPYRAFNFVVDIDNIAVASFSEVAGLTAEGDPVEYREGADAENHVRKLPGLRKYTNLTFKRGYTRDDTLWRWYTNIANGQNDRRSITITLLDEAHAPVMRWYAFGAFINKIEGPSFNATGNEVAIENMEVVHEKLTLELAG
ncbi:phage tail protein [Mangrovimicrobium sediminis]|nr:phage tail protein [Haliea sp. SAOS-164]